MLVIMERIAIFLSFQLLSQVDLSMTNLLRETKLFHLSFNPSPNHNRVVGYNYYNKYNKTDYWLLSLSSPNAIEMIIEGRIQQKNADLLQENKIIDNCIKLDSIPWLQWICYKNSSLSLLLLESLKLALYTCRQLHAFSRFDCFPLQKISQIRSKYMHLNTKDTGFLHALLAASIDIKWNFHINNDTHKNENKYEYMLGGNAVNYEVKHNNNQSSHIFGARTSIKTHVNENNLCICTKGFLIKRSIPYSGYNAKNEQPKKCECLYKINNLWNLITESLYESTIIENDSSAHKIFFINNMKFGREIAHNFIQSKCTNCKTFMHMLAETSKQLYKIYRNDESYLEYKKANHLSTINQIFSYLDKPIDYCSVDEKLGTTGMIGRECQVDKVGENDQSLCTNLCCGSYKKTIKCCNVYQKSSIHHTIQSNFDCKLCHKYVCT